MFRENIEFAFWIPGLYAPDKYIHSVNYTVRQFEFRNFIVPLATIHLIIKTIVVTDSTLSSGIL